MLPGDGLDLSQAGFCCVFLWFHEDQEGNTAGAAAAVFVVDLGDIFTLKT